MGRKVEVVETLCIDTFWIFYIVLNLKNLIVKIKCASIRGTQLRTVLYQLEAKGP